MSKPCPNFQMKICASTWVILEFLHPLRAALSLWRDLLNEQSCCQTKKCSLFSLLERCVTHQIPPGSQHSFTGWGSTGGNSGSFLQHFLTAPSINTNWNVSLSHLTKWLAHSNYFFFLLCEEELLFSAWNSTGKVSSNWQHTYIWRALLPSGFFFWSSHNLNFHIKCLP